MNIVLAVIMGTLFGLALYIAGASNPSKLTAMLRLQYLTLMKIIIFAIGLSSILVAASNLIGIFNVDHFTIKSTNLGVIVGGLIFGIGFGWAGTCPGTCVAAVGGRKGVLQGLVAVAGGLTGAFCFSISYGWWKRLGIFDILDLGKITLFQISDGYNFLLPGSYWGLLIAGAIFIIVAVLIPD